MKTLFYTIMCCLIFAQLNAQKNQVAFHQNENPEWMTFKSSEPVNALELVQNKTQLKLSTHDELTLLSIYNDDLGYRHYRYQQTYKGLPIEGAVYLLHEKEGRVKSANGTLIRKLSMTTAPAISEAAALAATLQYVGADLYAWNDPTHEDLAKQIHKHADATFYPSGELVIIKPKFTQNTDNYHLAYKFDIYAVQPLTRQVVYIDAQNGTIIKSIEKIHQCNNIPASGDTNYSGAVDFSACQDGNTYTLKNNINGVEMQVFNANNTQAQPQIPVTDTDTFFDTDPRATEVHWATQKTYEYFRDVHGRNSLDDNGMPLYSWVHYGNNYNNAFWNGSWMTYGDGNNERYSSLTSPDVVAHEMMHGVTDFGVSGLIYEYESGALNESFSDIFGEVVERHCRGTNDWIMGADFTVKEGKNGIRNMSNPNDLTMIHQQPDTYLGNYWYEGEEDDGGVHRNSGVQNYWFYLLSEGGSGINDNGDAYDITGIGMTKAAAIAYRNLTQYLAPTSDYADARIGSLMAAQDLQEQGTLTESDVQQVEAAWSAVGVGDFIQPSGCSVNDSLALVAIYNATDGPNWGSTYVWNLNEPMNNWSGVTLNLNRCVIDLKLSYRKMTGSIPAEIGNLSYLQSLSFYNAGVGGSIPPEIGNLSQLTDLNLGQNELVGSIPAEIGNLTNLRSLSLIWNNLVASIPPEIGNLSKLTTLGFYQNSLIGTIPAEIGNLTELTSFDLRFNHVTGNIPAEIWDLNNLLSLYLSDNQLSGNLPPEVGNLSKLITFDVARNDLIGNIPTEIGNLNNLANLYLSDNDFTGNIPAEIGNLNVVTRLSLAGNELTGSIPAEIGNLNNLTWMRLINNDLSGCYDANLLNLALDDNSVISAGNNFDASWDDFMSNGAGACTTPVYPDCRQSDSLALVALHNVSNSPWTLTDPLDTWEGVGLNGFGCVARLNLAYKLNGGIIPANIGNLSHLLSLDFKKCKLSGSIPPELGNLNQLTNLDLSDNDLTGNIPSALGNLNNLQWLYLNSNDLTGNIPTELNNLNNLLWLKLSFNDLTGNIPSELGNLSSLKWLHLGSNDLTGNIPVELGNLNQLQILELSGNDLSGNIPVELGALNKLEELNMGFNDLTGSIPTELANLNNLKELGIALNKLTGSIPPQIANLSKLTELHVQKNQLSGCYDANLQQLCSQLKVYHNTDSYISEGNNFEASWEEFCATGAGACLPPELSCRQNDSLALVALYEATDGANWTNTWDLTQPIDDWYGVNINADDCVWRLHLQFNNLIGQLPAEIGNLTNLEQLDLSSNQLSGNLPPEIGNWVNIERMLLHRNLLTGNIPVEIGNLNTAQWIYLFDNQLTGNIPSTIGDLNNIEKLHLSENQLTGSLPSELGNLNNLNSLLLFDNQLNGCYDNNLTSLCNQLTNSSNANISNGNNFDATWEDFCTTDLGACVPPPEMPCRERDSLALVALYNSTNGVNWTNPWNLTQPIDTWLGVNLNGEGCVEKLNLISKNLVGSIPPEIGNLTSLTILYMGDNELSGNIPLEIGNLTNLIELSLRTNQLTGSIPLEIENLTKLIYLGLHANLLSGGIPPELGNLNNLEILHIGSNQLTGIIPIEIGNLTSLTKLYMGDNELSGNIPLEIGNLTNLTELSLRTNQLTGSIPPEIGDLTKLIYLGLHANLLSGSIPPELGNLSNLVEFYLYTNQLSGCYDSNLLNLCSQLTDYSITYNNNFDATWEDFCTTGAGTCQPVLPGDFNNDGIANNIDAIFWGLAAGNTGPIRPNADTSWTPQYCPEWSQSVIGVNGKHQDGDGSGLIDTSDLSVLIHNYGEVYNNLSSPSNISSPLKFNVEFDRKYDVDEGTAYAYKIYVQSSLEGVLVGVHGLAGSIDLNDVTYITSAKIDTTGSVLEPAAYINNYDNNHKTLDFALTRTDKSNQYITEQYLLVECVIVVAKDVQSGDPVKLEVDTGSATSANGNLTSIDGTSFYAIINDDGGLDIPLSISANTTNPQCGTLGSASVQIIKGTAPYTYSWSTGANTAEVTHLIPGTYTVEVSDANDQNQTLTIQINEPQAILDDTGNEITCPQTSWLTPQLSVWLEGAYDTNTSMMNNGLRQNGALPAGQPYHEPPWKYRGTEGQGWAVADYPTDVVDWVLVSFRSAENKQNVLRKTAAILQKDGSLYFPVTRFLPADIADSLYVVIEHRNHIAAMTPQPIAIVNDTLTYDFRTADSYSEGGFGQKELSNGTWGMYAGDGDQSDQGGYDINGSDIGIWTMMNGNFGGYFVPDFNLDGDINGADKIIWSNNNGINSQVPR